jgi:hypothetical protein
MENGLMKRWNVPRSKCFARVAMKKLPPCALALRCGGHGSIGPSRRQVQISGEVA